MADQMGSFKPGMQTAMGNVDAQREQQAAKLESEITPMPAMPTEQKTGFGKDFLKSHIGLFAAMSLLSALGARHTSTPMTAAMNNMTASMKGFMSGNAMEQQQANKQMWEQFDAAMQQHRASLERYKIGLEKMYKDPKAGQQQLYMELLKEGYDPKMAAEMSSPASAARIYEANLKAQAHAQDASDRAKKEQQRHQDQQKSQFERERSALELKKAQAVTPEAKKNYQDQIDALNMRERITIGAEAAKPTGGFSGAQENWISRAMAQNPGMTREQVIDEGKKLGRL